MGLGLEKAAPNIMDVPPRPVGQGPFTKEIVLDTIVYGIAMGALALGSFILVLKTGTPCDTSISLDYCNRILRARGTALAVMTFLVLLQAYNCRHLRHSIFRSGGLWWDNKWLFFNCAIGCILVFPTLYIPVVNEKIFRQAALTWEWGLAIGSLVAFLSMAETYKWAKRVYFARRSHIVDVTPHRRPRKSLVKVESMV